MNNILRITVITFAATLALSTNARADDFNYAGTIVTWTAPTTGTYFIDAFGAQGGYGPLDGTAYRGGRGAEITGSFTFAAGTVLQLAVGGMGSSYAGSYNGGGGGGSYVVDLLGNPLLIAGGGGGVRAYANENGSDASITEYAKEARWPGAGEVTKTSGLGQGGIVSSWSWGGGGAGFYSNGAMDFAGVAMSWANGLAGGAGDSYGSYCSSAGGFGGGGSGTGCGGGGGGGGYSGGDGGFIAGGGGSFNSGFDRSYAAGVGYGNGSISITAAVPEPETYALLLGGLALVGFMTRRRRSA